MSRVHEPAKPSLAPGRALARSSARRSPEHAHSPAVASRVGRFEGAAAPATAMASALPEPLKTTLEAMSRLSLADVRVHRDSPSPALMSSVAFADGNDIHLAPGEERHLPHEAWHVVQQKQGRVRATGQYRGVGVNDDRALEREADTMAARAAEVAPPFGQAAGPALPGVPTGGSAAVQRRISSGEDQATIEARRGLLSPEAGALFDAVNAGGSYTLDDAITLAEELAMLSVEERNRCFELRESTALSLRQAIDQVRRQRMEIGAAADGVEADAEAGDGGAREARHEWAGNEEESEAEGGNAAGDPAIPPEFGDLLDGVELSLPGMSLRRGRMTGEQRIGLGAYLRTMGLPRYRRIERQRAVLDATRDRLDEELRDSNPDPRLLEALGWAVEALAFSPVGGSGGAGSLSVVRDEGRIRIRRRAGWEAHVDEALGRPRPGQHRRHIIAWHTIRQAVENVINRLVAADPEMSDRIVAGLEDFLRANAPAEQADEEMEESAERDPLLSVLERVLSTLNSNPGNLWLGEGYENSLINTFQHMMRGWAEAVLATAREEGGDSAAAGLIDRLGQFEARSMASGNARYRIVSESVLEFVRARIAVVGHDPGAMAAVLRKAADQFEVDYHFIFSGRSPHAGPRISAEVLRLAGRLLSWAEEDGAELDEGPEGEAAPDRLLAEFEAALDGFMAVPTYRRAGKGADDGSTSSSASGGERGEILLPEGAAMTIDADVENRPAAGPSRQSASSRPAPGPLKRKRSDESAETSNEGQRRPKAPVPVPDRIDGVGSIENVSGRGMDCMIRAVLLSAGNVSGPGFEPQVDRVRDFLVESGAVVRGEMLDATGPSGQLMMNALEHNGLLNGHSGLIVHYRHPATGALVQELAVAGAAPIHIWFSAAHFRAIIPHAGP